MTAAAPLSITELTRKIKGLLERELGEVSVAGEISNLRAQSSGHLYFTLKDAGAQISAVMFRGSASRLGFRPRDGMQVKATGEVSVYEVRGQYQIIVHRLEQAGLGELQARFEELKRKLQAEGLFDAGRKKTIPRFPASIGIVTSPTGAALQDMLNITRRRFPGQHLIISPVRVQGAGAAEEIAEALEEFNRLGNVEVIVLARGGGSLEDLWAFNEEIVARAVAASALPTVSAVGHEIDYSICDFCADLRAPTPSAAAEILVPHAGEVLEGVRMLEIRLRRETRGILENLGLRLKSRRESYVFREPERIIGQYQQRVDEAIGLLLMQARQTISRRTQQLSVSHNALERRSPRTMVARSRQRWEGAVARLPKAVLRRHQQLQVRVAQLREKLALLSPQNVLERGFAIVTDEKGRLVRSVKQVRGGGVLRTKLADGTVESVAR
ncbi:MAG: exodeoxyribonuclease VII large subunit [Verrucomicrobiae bacterium]|nr:exodeoxyribonuclease VII large subunit [Verrucomicrobiae bacterium]